MTRKILWYIFYYLLSAKCWHISLDGTDGQSDCHHDCINVKWAPLPCQVLAAAGGCKAIKGKRCEHCVGNYVENKAASDGPVSSDHCVRQPPGRQGWEVGQPGQQQGGRKCLVGTPGRVSVICQEDVEVTQQRVEGESLEE